jgi:hypothetical protein
VQGETSFYRGHMLSQPLVRRTPVLIQPWYVAEGFLAEAREYPEFCVSEPYLSKGEKYGDQERDFRRVIEG